MVSRNDSTAPRWLRALQMSGRLHTAALELRPAEEHEVITRANGERGLMRVCFTYQCNGVVMRASVQLTSHARLPSRATAISSGDCDGYEIHSAWEKENLSTDGQVECRAAAGIASIDDTL